MKYLNNRLSLFGLAFLFVGMIGVTVGDLDFPLRAGEATTTISTTFSNGDTDTLEIGREASVANLAFGFAVTDSVDIDSIVVRRIVNNNFTQILGSDKLSGADSLTTTGSRVYTITLAPVPESYKVVVYYGNDAGGVQAGSTNTIRYSIHKGY